MANYSRDEIQEALRPLESLISKSEKAQQKLKPGTWQHTMLRDNQKALHLASALMEEGAGGAAATRDELEAALQALASMIAKAEEAKAKFAPGTSHHTLQRNRLKALRIAEALVETQLHRG